MNSSTNPSSQPARSSRTPVIAAIFLVMLILFGWVYYYEPFTPISDYLNDKIGDVLTLIPALAAAIWGTQLMRQFKPSEPPHRIWLTFTLGWWCWVGGELLGFVYDHFYWTTDYPEFTFIDLFWTLGYIFFGLSLYYQFRLIYSWKSGRKSLLYLFVVAIGLAIVYALTEWARVAGLGEDYSWFALYLAVFYPTFDVIEGLAALWLFFLFGRGYLGRPWWGLIAFAIADSINIYSWMGGFDATPENIYYMIDLVSALTYVAGYMITALAFYSAIGHMRRALTKLDAPA